MFPLMAFKVWTAHSVSDGLWLVCTPTRVVTNALLAPENSSPSRWITSEEIPVISAA